MKKAIYMANLAVTLDVVEVLEVKGGWSTIRTRDGIERKMRNSQVERNNELLTFEQEAANKATKSKKTTKAKVAKSQALDINSISVCPSCGGEHLYRGEAPNGLVINEDLILGCHDCDWVYDERTSKNKALRYVKNTAYDPNNYAKTTSAKGFQSMDCGDRLAKELRSKELDEVYEYASRILETAEVDLRTQYKHLNVGMQRMNLGNRIRGVLAKKEE